MTCICVTCHLNMPESLLACICLHMLTSPACQAHFAQPPMNGRETAYAAARLCSLPMVCGVSSHTWRRCLLLALAILDCWLHGDVRSSRLLCLGSVDAQASHRPFTCCLQMQSLLNEVLLLIGLFAVISKRNQHVLLWGKVCLEWSNT